MKKYYNLFSLRRRLLFFVVACLVCFVGLFVRLVDICIIRGSRLQVLASEQWMRGLPLAAKRGEIFDCNGNILVTNETTYDIYIRARNVKDANFVATELSKILNISYNGVFEKAKNIRISESLVKMQVSYENSMLIISKNLDGVYLSQNVSRVYPYNDLLTQILGYTTIDNCGQAGVEAFYDKYLKGVAGRSLTETNARGKELENTIRHYYPSIDGLSMTLEIDLTMQLTLEKYLQIMYEQHKAKGATGIILDAQTGAIVAMTSKPSFDLNSPPRDNIPLLNDLTKNKMVVDIYEPGSTFKIITLAAALNEHVVSLNDRFYCSGSIMVDGEKIKCWRSHGHGSQTLQEAFKNSCNCAFVNIANRIGIDKFYKYLDMFGVGDSTGVDIMSESSGMVMSKASIRNIDMLRMGFGHAIAVTPLQLANVAAKILTNNAITPHLLKSFEQDGKTIISNNFINQNVGLKDDTVKLMRELLVTNINGFDGNFTFVEGYDIGGKTGTAQKYDDRGIVAAGKYISSFLGVYPTKNPKYIMLLTCDEPTVGGYYGGVVVSPFAKLIFKEIFEKKNIVADKPSDLLLKPNIEMPNLIGLSVAKACAILKNLGLVVYVDNDGSFISAQYPVAGTFIYSNEEVLVETI